MSFHVRHFLYEYVRPSFCLKQNIFNISPSCGCPKVLATLRTAHANGEAKMGVDVDGDSVSDKAAEGVVDLMSTKESALRLAVDAAVTVLRVSEA